MKATATVVTRTVRSASMVIDTIRAAAAVSTRKGIADARAVDAMAAGAKLVPNGVRVDAGWADGVGLHHYLRVTPEETQELVWLTPQVGIEYVIDTSTNLQWNIT